MDPFNSKSIAQARHAETVNQRRDREAHWVIQLAHLPDDRLHSFFDVAEELIQLGFQGDYGQTQRLARDVRAAIIESRSLHPTLLPLYFTTDSMLIVVSYSMGHRHQEWDLASKL